MGLSNGAWSIKTKEQNSKNIHGRVIFRGNILLFLFVNFLQFEFCQNFVDSRHLKCSVEKYYNDKRFDFSNAWFRFIWMITELFLNGHFPASLFFWFRDFVWFWIFKLAMIELRNKLQKHYKFNWWTIMKILIF